MHGPGIVRVDVVRAVAVDFKIDTGVRRIAGKARPVHLGARAIHRNVRRIGSLGLCEERIATGSPPRHDATAGYRDGIAILRFRRIPVADQCRVFCGDLYVTLGDDRPAGDFDSASRRVRRIAAADSRPAV